MARLPFAVSVAPDSTDPLGRAISAIITASTGMVQADNKAAKESLANTLREQAVILADAGYDPADIDTRVRHAFTGSTVKGTAVRYSLALADAVFILNGGVVTPAEFSGLSVAKIEERSADARDSGFLVALENAKLAGNMLAKLAKLPGKRDVLAALAEHVVGVCKSHGAKAPTKRDKSRAPASEQAPGKAEWPNPQPVNTATDIAA